MRKLEGITKKKYNVVIIDHENSGWLEYCLPKECTSFAVKTRNILLFVKSFSFLYSLVRCIIKHGLTSVSLLAAIILELKPEVVITFIDNNRFMGKLQTIFPDILVISVQNGMRSLYSPNFEPYEKYFSAPHYFGFGGHELNMIESKGASVKKYYSKGSLKMGIFLSNFYSPIQSGSHIKNICLISNYKSHYVKSTDLMDIKFISSFQEVCKLLSNFSRENGVDIAIAMMHESSSKEYQNELNFFESIFGYDGAICFENDSVNMSSYQVGMDSDLVVAWASTLLFELFGAEKKILCGGNVEEEPANFFGLKGQFDTLPHEVLLDSWDYEEFKEKASALLEMNNDKYIDITKNARKHYMNFGDKYPHQIIYDTIQCKYKEQWNGILVQRM